MKGGSSAKRQASLPCSSTEDPSKGVAAQNTDTSPFGTFPGSGVGHDVRAPPLDRVPRVHAYLPQN